MFSTIGRLLFLNDRGNRRADTFRNVLQNPKVGLIFLVPGKGETLRISGSARIVRDSWLREKLAHKGIVPELALIVRVEEVFAHCTKCMVRSGLWKPESWKPEGLQFTIGSAMVHMENLDSRFRKCRPLRMNGCGPSLLGCPNKFQLGHWSLKSLCGQLTPMHDVDGCGDNAKGALKGGNCGR